jgi:hypothetical protein
MMEQLKASIVRFRKPDYEVVGTGFLVGEQHILTCAHIVRDALGLTSTPAESPDTEIHLDFPFSGVEQIFTAKVVLWHPRQDDNSGDIAGLLLNGFPPRTVRPATLNIVEDLWDHHFRTFGFPTHRDDGVWVSGLLRDIQATGWIQMNVITETGYAITPGFSGSPVWDDESTSVVGMTVVADMQPNIRAAYMVSASTINQIWTELQPPPDNYERIELPIVIVAMTQSEANDLFQNPEFIGRRMLQAEANRFRAFLETFSDENIASLSSRYANERKNWKPYSYTDETLRKIILEIIRELNDWCSEEEKPILLRPRFLSSEFFAHDTELQNETWDELTETGCVVFVDAVSLFHPDVRQALIQSHISAHPNVAVLVLPPIDMSTIPSNQQVDMEIRSWMQRAFDRFEEFDRFCEFGLGNVQTLKRWLFHNLPEIVNPKQVIRSVPNNRRRFRRKMKMRPSGLGNLITRGGMLH